MPKARRRKSGAGTLSGSTTHTSRSQQRQEAPLQKASTRTRSVKTPQGLRPHNLLFSGMVALGCWGMALSFFVFDTEPNHLLLGGMVLLMAIGWSIAFGLRLRKFLRVRQTI